MDKHTSYWLHWWFDPEFVDGVWMVVNPLGTIFKLLITQGSMQVHEAPVSINNLQVTGGKTGIPNDNNRSRLGIEIPILISIIGPPKVI